MVSKNKRTKQQETQIYYPIKLLSSLNFVIANDIFRVYLFEFVINNMVIIYGIIKDKRKTKRNCLFLRRRRRSGSCIVFYVVDCRMCQSSDGNSIGVAIVLKSKNYCCSSVGLFAFYS